AHAGMTIGHAHAGLSRPGGAHAGLPLRRVHAGPDCVPAARTPGRTESQPRRAVTRPIMRMLARYGIRVNRLEYQANVANPSGVITSRRDSIPRTARRAMISEVKCVRESSFRAISSACASSPDNESAKPDLKNCGQITDVVIPRGRSSASRVSPSATAAALVAL